MFCGDLSFSYIINISNSHIKVKYFITFLLNKSMFLMLIIYWLKTVDF
jgi:hypothetical protein